MTNESKPHFHFPQSGLIQTEHSEKSLLSSLLRDLQVDLSLCMLVDNRSIFLQNNVLLREIVSIDEELSLIHDLGHHKP